MKLTRVLCVVPVVVGACTDAYVAEVRVASASLEPEPMNGGGSCTTADCGLNSAMIDGTYFSELYRPLVPFAASLVTNSQGIKIRHFYRSETDWFFNNPADALFDVEGGKLVGARPGAILELSGPRGEINLVKIVAVDRTQVYWTEPAPGSAHRPIETYWLSYTKPAYCVTASDGSVTCTNYQPLCKDKPLETGVAMPAVVFEGDRYDQDTLTVSDSSMTRPSWFNIACMGSLPAKMYLTRRTQAAAMDPLDPIPVAPLPARQAFVHMWSANYCGDGYSFTETGHPLRIRDRDDTMSVELGVGFQDEDAFSFEAVWGAEGAICLGQPRLSSYTFEDVQQHCASLLPPRVLDKCPADILSTWTSLPGAAAISVTPSP
jgi:hypothetical protein